MNKTSYTSGGKDSLVKVIDVYFAHVTSKPFTFGGKTYEPKDLRVSPNILRGFSCLANCGACCRNFTLDFLPAEKEMWDHPLELREVELNGKMYPIWSDLNQVDKQVDKFGKDRCKYLNLENGRCGIHQKHPFSCDFELLRFIVPNPKKESNVTPRLSHQLFGRGWQMQRIDGERGAMCSMLERTEEDRQSTIRKLTRLKDWTDHFELETVLPKIISWVSKINLSSLEPLVIIQQKTGKELI